MTNHDDDFDRMARSAGAALRRPAPEDGLIQVRAIRKRRQTVRTTMVGVAGLAIVMAGVALAQGRRDNDAGTPTAPVPATTLAPRPTLRPLALPTVPKRFALAGQGIRPVADENVRGAVFVKRDADNVQIERVIVRLSDEVYRGEPGLQIPIPANLAPAEGSAITLFNSNRAVQMDYGLGNRGSLVLFAYHDDPSSYGALTDEMQQIAATLSFTPGQPIGTVGTLPEGWSLAAAGSLPYDVAPSYVQAFEIDRPDGGNKVIVENRFLHDASFPYWSEFQHMLSLTTTIRGHAGFVTVVNNYGPDGASVEPVNVSSMLTWEESPDQWVTLWAGGMTTEQALALADQLVSVPVADWGSKGDFATTTTTTTLT